MELDSFTQKLLERTQARRENIGRKLVPLKNSDGQAVTGSEGESGPTVTYSSANDTQMAGLRDTREGKQRGREPLADENGGAENRGAEDSQKRKYSDDENHKSSPPKRRSVETPNKQLALNNKENNSSSLSGSSGDGDDNGGDARQVEKSESRYIEPQVSFGIRGLAALRRKNHDDASTISQLLGGADNNCTTPPTPNNKPGHFFGGGINGTPEQTVKTRTRLAALAKDINQWEDNSGGQQSNLFPPTSLSTTTSLTNGPPPPGRMTTPQKAPFSSSSSPSFRRMGDSDEKFVSDEKKLGSLAPSLPKSVGLPSSGGEILPPSRPVVFPPHPQQEAQGFTKSPSASKLTYAYRPGQGQRGEEQQERPPIKDRVKMFEEQQEQLNNNNADKPVVGRLVKWPPPAPTTTTPPTTQEGGEPIFKDTSDDLTNETDKNNKMISKNAPINQNEKKHVSCLTIPSTNILQEKLSTILSSTISPHHQKNSSSSAVVDPSSFSLSARRAMFEKSTGKGTESGDNPELLSVAQRTSLFEKAMLQPPAPKMNRSPSKMDVGLKGPPGNSSSPARPLPSAEEAPPAYYTSNCEVSLAESGLGSPPPPPPPPLPPFAANGGILRRISSGPGGADSTGGPAPALNAVKKSVRFGASPIKSYNGFSDDHVNNNNDNNASNAVESHTKLLQMKLLEEVNKKTENGSVDRALEERKREIEALKRRWQTPTPSSSASTASEDEEEPVVMEPYSSSSEEEYQDAGDANSSGYSFDSEISFTPPPKSSLKDDELIASPFLRKPLPRSSALTPQRSFTKEANDVCDQFDQMLDNAMTNTNDNNNSGFKRPTRLSDYLHDDNTQEMNELLEEAMEACSTDSSEETLKSPPRLYPLLPKLDKSPLFPGSTLSSSCRSPGAKSAGDAVNALNSPTPAKISAYRNPCSASSAKNASPPFESSQSSPLAHSVSFYRRQKQQHLQQQQNLTPVLRVPQQQHQRSAEEDGELLASPNVSSPPARDTQQYYDDVENKIRRFQEDVHRQDVQVKQTCQALSLCAAKPEFFGSTEHVEGERLLLIASHKRNSSKNFIEQLKTEAALGPAQSRDHGTLTISDIRLPLKQEFLAAKMAGHTGDAVHYFFCLLRYREKVIASEMLSTKDGIAAGTFTFSNHICLQELRSNFVVLFEVYALDSNKLKLAPKSKKLDSKAKLSPAIANSPLAFGGNNKPLERPSNFDVVGTLGLTLENCRRRVLPMEKVPLQSPLDGRVSMKLQLCTEQPVKEKGFLTMFEDVSGFGAWHRRWCSLAGNHLSYWKYPDHEKKEVPIGSIDLRQCITPEVGLVSADICARKHTFLLLLVRPQTSGDQNTLVSQSHNTYTTTKHLLSADTKAERLGWCAKINRAIEIVRKWDPEALTPVHHVHQNNNGGGESHV